MASAGGQLRALNGLQSGSPRDLAIGIDASEIDCPVWSVSDRGTAGALDRCQANDVQFEYCDLAPTPTFATLPETLLAKSSLQAAKLPPRRRSRLSIPGV
jgi:hypothetical protein